MKLLAVAVAWVVVFAAAICIVSEAQAEGPQHPLYEDRTVALAEDGTYSAPPGRHCKTYDIALNEDRTECEAQPQNWPAVKGTSIVTAAADHSFKKECRGGQTWAPCGSHSTAYTWTRSPLCIAPTMPVT